MAHVTADDALRLCYEAAGGGTPLMFAGKFGGALLARVDAGRRQARGHRSQTTAILATPAK